MNRASFVQLRRLVRSICMGQHMLALQVHTVTALGHNPSIEAVGKPGVFTVTSRTMTGHGAYLTGQQCITQFNFKCRIYDVLVEAIMSYGGQMCLSHKWHEANRTHTHTRGQHTRGQLVHA
jgi:hypothetical protein